MSLHEPLLCFDCGRTDSPQWRRVAIEGLSVRVCNACGCRRRRRQNSKGAVAPTVQKATHVKSRGGRTQQKGGRSSARLAAENNNREDLQLQLQQIETGQELNIALLEEIEQLTRFAGEVLDDMEQPEAQNSSAPRDIVSTLLTPSQSVQEMGFPAAPGSPTPTAAFLSLSSQEAYFSYDGGQQQNSSTDALEEERSTHVAPVVASISLLPPETGFQFGIVQESIGSFEFEDLAALSADLGAEGQDVKHATMWAVERVGSDMDFPSHN